MANKATLKKYRQRRRKKDAINKLKAKGFKVSKMKKSKTAKLAKLDKSYGKNLKSLKWKPQLK